MTDSPNSYWAATATPPPAVPPLEDFTSADVCIVVGGYLGLSAALHLAEAGASVVLVEAIEPGWGASGRNGGQIIPYWKVEHSKVSRQYGRVPEGQTAADFKKLMHHFRMEKDGRFLFGGRGGLRDSGTRSAYAPLLEKLAVLFPQLADVGIDFYWQGKVAITADGGPHLHRLAPGLMTAIGCNGRGIGMCTAAGRLVADLLGGMPDAASPMPITALKGLPFHGLRLAGVQAAVWFKAWQDHRAHTRQPPVPPTSLPCRADHAE